MRWDRARLRSAARSVLAEALRLGKSVTVFMHHGVIEHFRDEAKSWGEYLVEDFPEVGRMLASDAAAARAPRGFADRVMDRVYRETLWQPAAQRGAAAGAPARGYRRLGLCVMLGAAALVVCLVVPRAGLPWVAGSGPADNGSVLVKSVLDGADGVVRGALSAAGGSAARIVEGGSR